MRWSSALRALLGLLVVAGVAATPALLRSQQTGQAAVANLVDAWAPPLPSGNDIPFGWTPRTAPPAPSVKAVRAGRLFDAKAGRMLTNQIVLITGDRITDVGPAVQIPPGAETIDLSRATVLPGLIDTHVHLHGGPNLQYSQLIALNNAQLDLKAGFTTIVE